MNSFEIVAIGLIGLIHEIKLSDIELRVLYGKIYTVWQGYTEIKLIVNEKERAKYLYLQNLGVNELLIGNYSIQEDIVNYSYIIEYHHPPSEEDFNYYRKKYYPEQYVY